MEFFKYFDFFYLFDEQFTVLLILAMIFGIITKKLKMKVFHSKHNDKSYLNSNNDESKELNKNDQKENDEDDEEDLEEKDIKMIFVFIMDEKPTQNFVCENTTNLSLGKIYDIYKLFIKIFFKEIQNIIRKF